MSPAPKARDLWSQSTRYVGGDGPLPSSIMLIGEGPGFNEDRVGRPFVGRSGKVLDMLLWAAGVDRAETYITNIVKYRCTDGKDQDRAPTAEEIAKDMPELLLELDACEPSTIITIGASSTRALIDEQWAHLPMETLHGVPWPSRLPGAPLLWPVFHPAAGLRNPDVMAKVGWGIRQACAHHPKPLTDLYRLVSPMQLLPTVPSHYWNNAAVDTEGVPGKVICWSIATADGQTQVQPANAAFFMGIEGRLTMHNALWDMPICDEIGHDFDWSQVDDTMLMAFVLQQEPQGLKALAARHLRAKLRDYADVVGPYTEELQWTLVETLAALAEEDKDKKHWALRAWKDRQKGKTVDLKSRSSKAGVKLPVATLADVPAPEREHYSGEDAWATAQLAPILWKKVEDLGVERAYKIDLAALPMIDRMQRIGLRVDKGRLRTLQDDLEKEEERLRFDLQVLAGSLDFNPAAVAEVEVFLYEELGLSTHRKTKGGARSTDKKTLATLKHKGVDLLKQWREVIKTRGTFVEPLWALMGAGDEIHPRFKPTRTVSGRYAMEGPNLLAFPVRSYWGKRVRACFIARKGKVMASFDLSQIELRVAADESQDAAMLKVYKTGGDIHETTRAGVSKRVGKEIDRIPAKTLNFGVMYGMQEQGLDGQLTMLGLPTSLEERQAFIDGWFATYPGIPPYLRSKADEARQYGYVRSRHGRVRYLPLCRSDDDYLRAEADRQAGNFPIQAGASEEMKEGMARAWADWPLLEMVCGAQPLLQIHDDLTVEIDDNPLALRVAREHIMQALTEGHCLSVPVEAGLKVGGSWGEMQEVK